MHRNKKNASQKSDLQLKKKCIPVNQITTSKNKQNNYKIYFFGFGDFEIFGAELGCPEYCKISILVLQYSKFSILVLNSIHKKMQKYFRSDLICDLFSCLSSS
jgi:hypothetical protein